MTDDFRFDLQAKRTRLRDDELLDALHAAAETFGEDYFASSSYDALAGKRPHSSTIIDRFGSWKKALALIGISGGRERRHSPEQLVENLERVWKELGYPPGKRQIAQYGDRISETPYKRRWGSVRAACEALASFKEQRISREDLLAGKATDVAPTKVVKPVGRRRTVPLNIRYEVLRRDHFRCCKCGASPSADHSVVLEVDHVLAVARGGGNELANLQSLCQQCNLGKGVR